MGDDGVSERDGTGRRGELKPLRDNTLAGSIPAVRTNDYERGYRDGFDAAMGNPKERWDDWKAKAHPQAPPPAKRGAEMGAIRQADTQTTGRANGRLATKRRNLSLVRSDAE